MILLGKTTAAKINEIKVETVNQVKRMELHSRHAYVARNALLDLIPEDKREEAINYLGDFAERIRHLENARETIFHLGDQQRMLESKRPKWM